MEFEVIRSKRRSIGIEIKQNMRVVYTIWDTGVFFVSRELL